MEDDLNVNIDLSNKQVSRYYDISFPINSDLRHRDCVGVRVCEVQRKFCEKVTVLC